MMTDPEAELETTLELASMLAEPSLADRARVLRAVRGGLALAGAGAAGPALANGAANGVAPSNLAARAASRVQPHGAASAKLQGAALQQLVTVGVVAAALGFAAGWGLRDRTRTEDTVPRETLALPAPAPASEPERASNDDSAPVRELTPPPVDEAPAPSSDEPTPKPKPRVRKAAPSAPRAKPQDVPSAGPRSPAQSLPSAGPRSPAQDSNEFFEAVNLLRRAQRAVNRGDGQVALSLLAELDTRFDTKTLAEERQATRALALCASGDVEAATGVARELARVAPSSIYAGRLRLSCAGWGSANAAAGADRGTEPTTP
jgi:hypothetical protein